MADRRIGGSGGGSDPGKKKGTGFVVTVAVVIALGSSGVSAGGSATATRSSTSQGRSSSGGRSSFEIATEDFRSAKVRLVRRGLRVDGHLQPDGATCAEHAYGQVRNFFLGRPCADLHRAQFQVRDKKGDVVLVAVSWVQMPDLDSARAYKRLVDAYGTGNIIELSREGGRYRTVRYTGQRYASRRDGTVVANAQAEPVARGWTGLALTSLVNETVR
jgi:hypothetical protein